MIVEELSGRGDLVVDRTSTLMAYSLTVSSQGGLKSGQGEIAGKDAALSAAYLSERAMLTLEDGRVAPIIITQYSAGQGRAAFKLAGGIVGPALPAKN